MYPPQPPPPPTPPGPPASAAPPDPSDPVVASISSLVQEGTLSPLQANRVYAVMRPATQRSRRPLRAESPGYGAGWSREQLSAGVAGLLGGGLVVAAALVANNLANRRQDFNWAALVLELLAGLVIVAAGYAAWKFLPTKDAAVGVSAGVSSWLAALGILTLGLAVGTAMDGHSATPYIVGLVMFGLSAGAYFLVRGTVLTISALAGLAVFYAGTVGDTVSPDSALGMALVLVIFGALTVAAGWLLPSRHLTGMIGGIIALYGVLVSFVTGVFFQIGPALDGSTLQSSDNGALLVIGMLVTGALFGLHLWSNYPGYAVLGVAGAALVPSAGLTAIHPDHMLWWATGIAVIGCVAVAGALLYRVGGVRPLFDAIRTAR
jgi:hypothetical protein